MYFHPHSSSSVFLIRVNSKVFLQRKHASTGYFNAILAAWYSRASVFRNAFLKEIGLSLQWEQLHPLKGCLGVVEFRTSKRSKLNYETPVVEDYSNAPIRKRKFAFDEDVSRQIERKIDEIVEIARTAIQGEVVSQIKFMFEQRFH